MEGRETLVTNETPAPSPEPSVPLLDAARRVASRGEQQNQWSSLDTWTGTRTNFHVPPEVEEAIRADERAAGSPPSVPLLDAAREQLWIAIREYHKKREFVREVQWEGVIQSRIDTLESVVAAAAVEGVAEGGIVGARPDECICTEDYRHVGCPVPGHGWGATRAALSAATREMAALSSDKQTLMSAVTHWRERAAVASPSAPRDAAQLRRAAALLADMAHHLTRCNCDEVYTKRGRHEPNAICGDLDDEIAAVRAALAETVDASPVTDEEAAP